MLLAPVALILLLLAVPIILMYVLKLRRQEYRVPSTFLWQQVMQDLQANAPWQRLRFNILLLLQLIALAAVVLSLARPAYSRPHVIAGDLVVILDQSYGMQASDVKPSRFAAAQARARALAAELGGGHVMSVIGMGAQPRLAVADSGDQSAIDTAIDRLRVGVDQPNFLEALSLAVSLARSGQNTRVMVLTSRDSGISSLPMSVNFPVDIVRIGQALHDLAITGFSASQRPTAAAAVARVSNFGAQTAHSNLELYINGRLSDVRPLKVPAHSQQNLFWSDLPAYAQRLRVHLTAADDMSSDKSAWAAVPQPAPHRVLLITRGDYFLEAALADDPSVQLVAVPPAIYRPNLENAYDAVIFDGVLPPAFPTTSTLIIAPPPGGLGSLRFSGTRGGGAVSADSGVQGAVSPILQYVNLSDVHVAQTRSVVLPGWLQPLASAGANIALAAGERNNIRFALVNFDLQHSDWPLRISFPVALHNMLDYLTPGLALGKTNLAAGQAVTFFPPPGTTRIEVTRPGGTVVQISPPFPPFTATSRPGLYTVRAIKPALAGHAPPSGLTTSFAVNFFSSRPAPALGASTLHEGRAQTGEALTASIPVSLVWVFEVLALAALAVEWWISFRGVPLGRARAA